MACRREGHATERLFLGARNVRFGSLADILRCDSHVRSTPESGHVRCKERCPLCANSGHRFGSLLHKNVGQPVRLPTLTWRRFTPFLFGELQMQRTHMIRVTNLRIVERRKTEVISAIELVELHIVLTAGHEFA